MMHWRLNVAASPALNENSQHQLEGKCNQTIDAQREISLFWIRNDENASWMIVLMLLEILKLIR